MQPLQCLVRSNKINLTSGNRFSSHRGGMLRKERRHGEPSTQTGIKKFQEPSFLSYHHRPEGGHVIRARGGGTTTPFSSGAVKQQKRRRVGLEPKEKNRRQDGRVLITMRKMAEKVIGASAAVARKAGVASPRLALVTIDLTTEERNSLLLRAVAFLALALTIELFVINVWMPVGPSNLPTLNCIGDVVLADRISPIIRMLGGDSGGGYQRGDLVRIFDVTTNDCVIKRIVALPGDYIHTDGEYRHLYPMSDDDKWRKLPRYFATTMTESNDIANGTKHQGGTHSNFNNDTRTTTMTDDNIDSNILFVPNGHVWVEGDNPPFSRDSRHYGPVPLEYVWGRIFLRVWPLRVFGGGGDVIGKSLLLGRDRPIPPTPCEQPQLMTAAGKKT